MLGRVYDRLDDLGAKVSRLTEIEQRLNQMEFILSVREPSTFAAAEAYEQLRKQVVAGAHARASHIVDLARIDSALQAGAAADDLASLLDELLMSAGVLRDSTPAERGRFRIAEGDGDELEILAPAYVDAATQRTIREGIARAVATAQESQRITPLSTNTEADVQGHEGGEE